MAQDAEDGLDQIEDRMKDHDKDKELSAAREGKKSLLNMPMGAVAKHIAKRWDGLERTTQERLAALQVNWLKYEGTEPFAQVHPKDSTKVWRPPKRGPMTAPTTNQIPRAVDRYVAQMTADEPIMEGVPVSHRDDDRDAAEAASQALRGEFARMNLLPELQRALNIAAILRSAFWMFQWDDFAGGMEPARKFFDVENGERVLLPVDESGNSVDDIRDSAKIRVGNITLSTLTLANVRWYGGRRVDVAQEVIVGEMLPLRRLYEIHPASREVKLSELVTDGVSALDGMSWLQDIRGENYRGKKKALDDDALNRTGEHVDDHSSLLDERVLLRHYFMPPSRVYPNGFHAISAGEYLLFRGALRYGIVPIAQLPFLEKMDDPTGRGLVDILRGPQEALDFVNGQVMRYLQMLKRRWFVPQHSGVKARDLMQPTKSIIEFNPAAGAPIPEQQPEIPSSLVNFIDRFDQQFEDQAGIHDVMQGKQVPGVSSGRQVEALRAGNETMLGLTHAQIVRMLERSSEIMLAIIKKEWKVERRVRYLGEDREYIDLAFSSTDFGETGSVQLKKGTFLMLTPAQRFEMVMSFADAGVIKPEEVRSLAPLLDTAGLSLSEDPHYRHARRQNRRFLSGPPEELTKAYDIRQETLEVLAVQLKDLTDGAELGLNPETVLMANKSIEEAAAQVEEEWSAVLSKFDFEHGRWQDQQEVSRVHAIAHAQALASEKAQRFPEWWVELFESHAVLEWQLGFPEELLAKAQVDAQVSALANPQGDPATEAPPPPA